LPASGACSDQVFSFARQHEGEWCLVLAPRWQARGRACADAEDMNWNDTRIELPVEAPRCWKNVLTGTTTNTAQANGNTYLEMAQALRDFPLALLAAVSPYQ
jgi:maltooligosyltrehalose synthase